jgi:putative membrane protein
MNRIVNAGLSLLVFGTASVVGACHKGEHTPDTSMAMMSKTDSTPAMTDTTRSLTDDQIFADLSAANAGEIAAGKMALSKASSADVKAFARQMIDAHTKMQAAGDSLAKKLNITPKPTADDSFTMANDSTSAHLQSAAKGTTFDTAYVNAQVAGHQMVLDFLRRAASQATAPDLKTMLTNAQPVVQHHLDMATALQAKLPK